MSTLDSSRIGTDTGQEMSTSKVNRLESVKIGKVNSLSKRKLLEEENDAFLIWPWNKHYKIWWGVTAFCAVLTVVSETYATGFSEVNAYTDAVSIIEYVLLSIFVGDIVINFHLVYYDANDALVTDKREIAMHYLKGVFWIDFVGVFPFFYVGLAIAGEIGSDGDVALYISLLRLVKLVRLHRMKELLEILQYNPHISLLMLTLIRNFGFAILWSHFSACIFFFIARMYDFDPDYTWIGGSIEGLSGLELYLTSLYWSVVTFTTTGYGDYSPKNPAEQIWCMFYLLLNMVAHAWIIGSITLLVVKQDEKTGAYREAVFTLRQYADLHEFPRHLEKKLRGQLQLDFKNHEISDEYVLGNFPTETRRKVLRRLYLPSLLQTNLMRGIRQQFVDAFLTTCKVEIFSSGDEILQRGSISSDLYLLIVGTAELLPTAESIIEDSTNNRRSDKYSQFDGTSITESRGGRVVEVNNGDFINAISFFTESPQLETVRTKTVCKTLTMPRTTYKMIAEDHPGSVGKLLQNLLENVEELARKTGAIAEVNLPTRLSILRAGSVYDCADNDLTTSDDADYQNTVDAIEASTSLTAVRDLVKMHLNKMKDDHTTRFLFAASRGDTDTISLMCDQGFDPNSADYDQRTALMVAAMKGNGEAVKKILEYDANPNLVDMHGSSALYEAARNGHDDAMEILLKFGAKLGVTEADAASRACQAVFDGDMLTLRRLLKAGLPVNAGDYDKRRATHLAAAEGNVAALKILVEFGADVNVVDRWGNTPEDEARKIGAQQVLDFLHFLKEE